MITMKNKTSRYIKFFIFSILLISVVCISIFTFYNKKEKAALSLNDKKEELLVSFYDTDGKSNITKINSALKSEIKLVSDRNVWLSGNLSEDKNHLVYMDAIGDEPWQIFSLDLKNKKTYKITTDNCKKFGGKSGMENTVYFEVFNSASDAAKIAKVNTKDKSSEIFDTSDTDRSFEVYDVRNNKIVAVAVSKSENNKRLEEANSKNSSHKTISYSIYEMNADGSSLKQIASVNANLIDSISYNYDCKKIIIGGKDINNENGSGIYEVSTDTGKLTKLLTDSMINKQKDSILNGIGSSRLGVISKDGKLFYFAGIPKGAKTLQFGSINSFPRQIYSYNLSNHKIKEVYKYKTPTIITDLTISY